MSEPDVGKVVKAGGRLILNPTDLDDAPSYGGTQLGLVRDIVFRPTITHEIAKSPTFGEESIELVYTGESAVMAAVMRTLDGDLLKNLFINTFTGAVTGEQVMKYPGVKKGGRLRAQDGFKLLFAPFDTRQHNFLIFYRAVPMIEEANDLQFSLAEEMGIAIAFLGMRDDSARVYQWGRREDIQI